MKFLFTALLLHIDRTQVSAKLLFTAFLLHIGRIQVSLMSTNNNATYIPTYSSYKYVVHLLLICSDYLFVGDGRRDGHLFPSQPKLAFSSSGCLLTTLIFQKLQQDQTWASRIEPSRIGIRFPECKTSNFFSTPVTNVLIASWIYHWPNLTLPKATRT